jgi:hypothetical protein
MDMAGGRDGGRNGVLHLAGDLVGLGEGQGAVEAAFGLQQEVTAHPAAANGGDVRPAAPAGSRYEGDAL